MHSCALLVGKIETAGCFHVRREKELKKWGAFRGVWTGGLKTKKADRWLKRESVKAYTVHHSSSPVQQVGCPNHRLHSKTSNISELLEY